MVDKVQAEELRQLAVSSPATQLSVLATDGGFQFLYPPQKRPFAHPHPPENQYHETFGLSFFPGAVGNFSSDV